MIPILFQSEATAFNTNGIGRLTDCISCTVTEERNGIFECEFEYPVTGIRYSEIKEGRLIVCTHDDKRDLQPFRIYRRSAPIDGIVTFNARHISYDLGNVILEPFTANSVAEAFADFSTHSMNDNPFTFWTNKATAANFKVTYPISIKAILGGMEGSILDVYGGGEYQWDKFTVRLYQTRGVDSGVTIRYGKNLVDITHEVDAGGVYNAVVPYWQDSNTGQVVYGDIVMGPQAAELEEYWTDENRARMTDENGNAFVFEYGRVITVPMDLSGDYPEGVVPTKAQLDARALQKLNSGRKYLPTENIEVDFVQLWQTDEYEDVAVLQRVSLCDTVSIYYTALGIVGEKMKVVKTVYNTLLDRYDLMELGEAKTSFAKTITSQITDEIIPQTVDMMQAAIDHATELITGGAGGHVVFEMDADGKPQEIYIMDTEDVITAVRVLRINMNGIGFSQNGINGPYATAWTIDGSFVADFITAGTLNANLIRAGVISSVRGNSYWNLETGDLVTASAHMDFTAGNLNTFFYSHVPRQLVYEALENVHYSYRHRSTGKTVFSRSWLKPYAEYYQDIIATIGKNSEKITCIVFNTDNLDDFVSGSTVGTNDYALLKEAVYYDDDAAGLCYWINTDGSSHPIWVRLTPEGVSLGSIAGDIQIGKKIEASSFHSFANCTYIGNDADGHFLARHGGEVEMDGGTVSGSTTSFSANGTNYSLVVSENAITVSNNGTGDPGLKITKNGRVMADASSFFIGSRAGASYQLYNSGSTLYWGSRIVQTAAPSSKRYKHGIKEITNKGLDPHRLLELPVKQFVYNEDVPLQYEDIKGKAIPGFIAEDVDKVYPSAVIHHPETGKVESWDERRIIPGMLALIQEQQKTIEALTARVERLEERLNADTRTTN